MEKIARQSSVVDLPPRWSQSTIKNIEEQKCEVKQIKQIEIILNISRLNVNLNFR